MHPVIERLCEVEMKVNLLNDGPLTIILDSSDFKQVQDGK